ncbi:sulfotransferase domain-containing protein [Pelagibacterales bacterium SAG-MED03]|nr:sulfotransferase domain-containing protein [Pelagibacterales bacterium SAG-MED03]
MIFWIASYPKSGNTWLRTLLSAYYYSKEGFFSDNLIKNIGQFPEKKHFEGFNYIPKLVIDTSRFWIKAQERINKDNKLRFFKTHNVFGSINNRRFTDKNNSIGCIYIVRDPRNVITSLKNHYELKYQQALEWMLNHKKYIYDHEKEEEFGDFQFISSWENNYKSWQSQKELPIKIVRYEDLLDQTYATFFEIIEFINKTTRNTDKKIDKLKLKNSINSTSFHKLKANEEKHGFSEAISSRKENKQIPFFFLGPENDWKKILDEDLKIKLNNIFKKNLKELSYI